MLSAFFTIGRKQYITNVSITIEKTTSIVIKASCFVHKITNTAS